jgi:hypothetical protein
LLLFVARRFLPAISRRFSSRSAFACHGPHIYWSRLAGMLRPGRIPDSCGDVDALEVSRNLSRALSRRMVRGRARRPLDPRLLLAHHSRAHGVGKSRAPSAPKAISRCSVGWPPSWHFRFPWRDLRFSKVRSPRGAIRSPSISSSGISSSTGVSESEASVSGAFQGLVRAAGIVLRGSCDPRSRARVPTSRRPERDARVDPMPSWILAVCSAASVAALVAASVLFPETSRRRVAVVALAMVPPLLVVGTLRLERRLASFRSRAWAVRASPRSFRICQRPARSSILRLRRRRSGQSRFYRPRDVDRGTAPAAPIDGRAASTLRVPRASSAPRARRTRVEYRGSGHLGGPSHDARSPSRSGFGTARLCPATRRNFAPNSVPTISCSSPTPSARSSAFLLRVEECGAVRARRLPRRRRTTSGEADLADRMGQSPTRSVQCARSSRPRDVKIGASVRGTRRRSSSRPVETRIPRRQNVVVKPITRFVPGSFGPEP